MMKPLQVYIDEGDLAALGRWAGQRGWTKSEAVRAAVRALLRSTSDSDADPLLDLEAMVQSGLPEDASEKFEEYLTATFVAERPSGYRRKRTTGRSTKK